nr:transposase [Burkholderia multivorans]
MRIVGLDVSRSLAEIAYLENGTLHAGGRTGLRRDELERFAEKLRATDHAVLEATGNTAAIVNVLRRHVAYVAIANPLQVRLFAEARVKTDKIDAAVLAVCKRLSAGSMDAGRTHAGVASANLASFTAGAAAHAAEERDSRGPGRVSDRAMPCHRSVRQEGACVARRSTASDRPEALVQSVHAGRGLHEHVLDVGEFRESSLGNRVAA